MTNPSLVFVHGGSHDGGCWTETIGAIAELDPLITARAVDLPGRRCIGGDLARLTIADCATSIVSQIQDFCDSGPIVLIGHSLAGVILAEIVDRLDSHIVERVVYVACCVPPHGSCVIDTLPVGLKSIAKRLAQRSPVIDAPPYVVLRFFFGNRATREQRRRIKAHSSPESSALLTEAPASKMPTTVHKSWIIPIHDRALPPAAQRRFIDGLDGVVEVIEIKAGHEVMITEPGDLARAIIQLTK